MIRFRSLVCLVIVLFAFVISANAQAKLSFPRLLSVNELSTTGIALVNTSTLAATATVNLYGENGSLVTQASVNVPARGQTARLATEILTSATAGGWIQITSSNAELQGFELVGDFATRLDGAGPAPESRQLAVIDFSQDDVIHVASTGGFPATVQITLNNAAGGVLTTKSVSLAVNQSTSIRLGDLNPDNNIDVVTINSDAPISASLTTKSPGGLDIGVINAVPLFGAPTTLYFPFTPNGPQGTANWKTFLGVANIGTSSQSVSLTFTPDSGSPTTIQKTLAAGASIGDSVTNLFSLSSTAFVTGWIKVTGSGALAGVAAYQDSTAGSLAVVPSQSVGATRFFFGHIASIPPWYTGIALLNTTTTTANVEISAIDSTGELIGSPATFTLAANTRRTSVLSEFVAPVLQRAADGGFVYVRTTNNVPLLGFELFGVFSSPILANVQGFAVSDNSVFVPPAGVSKGGGITLDVATVDVNGTTKTSFKPLDTIGYVAVMTNPNNVSGTAQVTFTVRDPRNQIMVTTTTSASLSAIGAGSISYIPSNALNGVYTFTATFVFNGTTLAKNIAFQVSGGTTTPSVGQELPVSMTTSGDTRFAFRPGDTVHFGIQTANFTDQVASGVVNYQLNGPGNLVTAPGSENISIPTGLSTAFIDIIIPTTAPQGLYALVSRLTIGSSTTSKTATITVVPKSSTESIVVDSVFVTDTKAVPQVGFTPGSGGYLNILRNSTFPLKTTSTVRYQIKAPDASFVFDQPLTIDVSNGPSVGSVPFTLKGDAALGVYTFVATITYQDNSNASQTATLSTTFTVANVPPTPTQTVVARVPALADINGVFRTSFSPGESLFLVRTVLSTFTTSVAGTVRYQVKGLGSSILLDSTVNTTFIPGINTSSIGIVTSASIPLATYTFVSTASAQGQTGSAESTFNFAGGGLASFNATVEDGPVVSEDVVPSPQVQRRLQEIIVNDDLESTKSQ